MIGSPDLVAFTKDDGFGEAFVDPWVLPEEFSVPLCTHGGNVTPWSATNLAKFTKDFILISEFSEQVGPQPLLTIPDDPRVIGTFDLNYFSLRIMSVDYQASFVGHLPGCSYPKINFVEDSKVVLGDSKEGAFAYVHHLTLYDLEARGFVRPFCMAYISADERKIMQQFQQLSLQFSKASELLKAGNRKAFATELEKKLKDLEYTMAVLHKEAERHKRNNGCYSTQAIEKANELANAEKSFHEHKDLLKQVKSFPNRKSKGPGFSTDSLDEPSDIADVDHNPIPTEFNLDGETEDGNSSHGLSYTPQLIKAKSAKCFDKRLKTLDELCDVYFFHQTMDQLHAIENIFRGDLSYIYTSQIEQVLLKKQKITNFLFEEVTDWDEEEAVKQICGGTHISESSLPCSILSGEPGIQETFISCEETLHIKIEPETGEEEIPETECRESSPCDTTQENSDESTYTEIKDNLSSGESVEVNEAEGHHTFQEPTVNSESFSSASNTKDLREGTGPMEHSMATDNATSFPNASDEDDGSVETCEDVVHAQVLPTIGQKADVHHRSVHEASPVIQQDTASCGQQEDMTDEAVPQASPRSSTFFFHRDSKQPLDLVPEDRTFSREPDASLLLRDLDLDGSTRKNLDDTSDNISCVSTSTTSEREMSPFPRDSPVTVKQKRRAGQSALKFIRQYPFAQQAIYSLLRGRTLVVLGVDEGTVRKLVNALTIFVPNLGKYGERVHPWLSCSFQLADLHNWKLVGLHRMASPTGSGMLHSLNRYSRYISILDTDNKTLRCPLYRGSVVTHMADHRTQIKRGGTYYMHVQSMLTELTSKAFLYTFCHHLHLPISPTEGLDAVALRRRDFLHHQWGYSEEDCRIVEFLSELIKNAYLQRPDQQTCPPVFCFNFISSLLYKI
ncbi:smith-Magenis syndrome chromosomal region candidate protein 8-like [Scleropages formosus]|uniref:Smith-Magenis syndrome chromosomal region candidate protein 8-like n=1 Tax=Scleropages formosus TaxID=113540 RepID=A0A0P7VKT5_SCLFO|nr:guanine nucleotide exchange protein smcr8a-like [Scleropages formosus]KPP74205.1 smith-Magenis syndrome chromosomal region candidate protein 8-like [Scleropages formosus]